LREHNAYANDKCQQSTLAAQISIQRASESPGVGTSDITQNTLMGVRQVVRM